MEINKEHNKEEQEGYLYEKIVVNFTEAMLEILEQKNLTRSEFASKMEVSPAYITKLLNGVNISVKQIAKIAVALDHDVELKMIPKDALGYGEDFVLENVFESDDSPLTKAANTHEYALAA